MGKTDCKKRLPFLWKLLWNAHHSQRGKTRRGREKYGKEQDYLLMWTNVSLSLNMLAWWFPEKGYEKLYGFAESNYNALTGGGEGPFNPEVGSFTARGLACKVYRAL